jgi:hypothetical protein
MLKLTLSEWHTDFQAAAKVDHYDIFRHHLRFLELPGEPITMMEATVLMVVASAAYYEIDRQPSDELLAMQQYNPAKAPQAPYVFTFDLNGHAYARLLVDPEVHTIDLADLYGHPWHPYKSVGYRTIWISHRDWTDLTREEITYLEEKVTEDLRFDYPEDELDFWFDDSNPKYLYVEVQDHCVEDDEDVG